MPSLFLPQHTKTFLLESCKSSCVSPQAGRSEIYRQEMSALGNVWGMSGKLFYSQLELFCLQLSFFAYSPERLLLDALFPTVSKKAPIVSKEAKTVEAKKLQL